jgi:hypothetical protein
VPCSRSPALPVAAHAPPPPRSLAAVTSNREVNGLTFAMRYVSRYADRTGGWLRFFLFFPRTDVCAFSFFYFRPGGDGQTLARSRAASTAIPRCYQRVSTRQHTSSYVSMRQHTSACVSMRQHTSAYCTLDSHSSLLPTSAPLHISPTCQEHLSVFLRKEREREREREREKHRKTVRA